MRQVAYKDITIYSVKVTPADNKKAIEDIIDRWPTTMTILCLQELLVYHLLDMSLVDFVEFIGQEKHFLAL